MTLLFTSTHETSFIAEDLRILRRHFDVHRLLTRSPLAPFQILSRIPFADVTFTWFASTYAAAVVLLAGILGKRSIVVIGGVDVARVDDAEYGQWRSPWKALLAGYVLRRAWRVLAVDGSLRDEAIRRADYDGENILVVPTGYDPAQWTPGGSRTRSVVTVAACESVSRLRIKGVPDLLQAARLLPEVPFTVVGISGDVLRRSALDPPPNVQILPFTPREELLGLYRRSSVCCQPSLFEGLPNSLCEAMLCGCVPVATKVGGSAGVVGEAGYLVPARDPGCLAEAIRLALDAPDEVRAAARERVSRLFPSGKREEALTNLIHSAAS